MYSVVSLIGSTRYKDLFRELEGKLSINGYLVFSPLVYNQSGDNPECGRDVKEILDIEAKLKISKSDIVLVVDGEDGYVGSSTKAQIEHALLLNKTVLYYSKNELNKLI